MANQPDYSEEWKACRDATDKFDNILSDLRKYGFSIVTGLTTAGSFLGTSSAGHPLQIGVIIVSMALIGILYWIDMYYQNLLFGSVLRTRILEVILKRGLASYIFALYKASHMGQILHLVYFGFLGVLGLIGLVASGYLGSNLAQSVVLLTLLTIGGGSVGVAMLIVYVACDAPRTRLVKKINAEIINAEYANKPSDEVEAEIKKLLKSYLTWGPT